MAKKARKSNDISRRSFIGAGLAAGSLVPGASIGAPQTASLAPGTEEKGKRRFTLWCATGGLINAEHPSDEAQVVAFVEKCAQHGVTHLVPTRGSRMLVEAAREKKIDVHPYLAFNSHGANREQYAWSVNYINDPGSPVGREQLGRHRAIWSHPKSSVSLTEFAKKHPEYWARTKGGGDTLEAGQRLNLSLAIPEVRSYEVERYLEIVNNSGGNGCQVEFVSTSTDPGGVGIYGYEDAMAKGFQEKYGRSPFDAASDDTSWLIFRADYVTQTLAEIREKLKQQHPGAPLSVAIIAREFTAKMMNRGRDRYLKLFQQLAAWLGKQVIDELFLWFRTVSDPVEVGRQTRQVADLVRGRCPLIVELSCYHVGSFQDPKLMLEAARRAKDNGADSVGMYRAHAVDQLNFWPLVEEISKMS